MDGENGSENKSAISVTSADVSSRSFEIAPAWQNWQTRWTQKPS
jgi:hypothetical protein